MTSLPPLGTPVALAPNQVIAEYQVLGFWVPLLNGVPVSGARGMYAELDPSATDGPQVACAVALAAATSGAEGGTVQALLTGRNPRDGRLPSEGVVPVEALVWPLGISPEAKAGALASLKARLIVAP